MTPDVVARAIEMCRKNILILTDPSEHHYLDEKQSALAWQTHLNEFGEHKRISLKTINVKVSEVGKVFDYERTCACGSVIIESECPIAVTKAKRLMGEEL